MKPETIKAPVAQVAFADLRVSDMNPRSVINAASIEALAANIKELGLIQNLAGLQKEDGTVEIVAGGRRLRALALLQDDERFQTVAVKLAPDAETAHFWASTENHHREALHPADEIREYGALAGQGVEVASIAIAFGVNETHVNKRLKLASLEDAVLDALKSDQISLGVAAAFTVATDKKLTLEVLEAVKDEGYNPSRVRDMLKPTSVTNNERRAVFVGVDAYTDAGGRTTQDLFAEQVFLDDVDVLAEAFDKKTKETIESFTADGWKWAEFDENPYFGYWQISDLKLERVYKVEGVLTEDQSARYDELSELEATAALDEGGQLELVDLQAILDGNYTDEQKSIAGVMFVVNSRGQIEAYEGLVRKEDVSEAVELGLLKPRHKSEPVEKSPISQKLKDDLSRVQQGALQNAMLKDGDLLIDLLAYQLSHNLFWANVFGLSKTDVPNWPSTEAEGYKLDPALTENAPKDMYGKDLGRSFRAFRKKGPEYIKGELVRFLAAQFKGGDEGLNAMIEKTVSPDTRSVWTPTAENFFKRVGGPYLNTLWNELLDLSEDDDTAKSFAKLKKSEKAQELEKLFGDDVWREAQGLTDEQITRIDAWLPEGMA